MRPLLILLLAASVHADNAREILDELIAIDTTNPPGNEAVAARAMAKRLAAFHPEVVEFAPGRADVVARIKGSGKKRPLLLLAHLDVVGTANQPWTMPPFKLTEKNGWLYGRGALDDKGWAAVATAVFQKLAGEKLDRDLILALTGDEESGGLGVRWLLQHRKDLIDAEIALNEGGGLKLGPGAGKVVAVSYQAAEKTYQSYELTAHGLGGHASIPNDENAIYRLARGLDRLSQYKFPVRLTPTVRESLKNFSTNQPEPRASAMRVVAASQGEPPADALAVLDAYPLTRAATRTTCVATMLSGGTRENALPAEAKAVVNCRVMPVDKLPDVQKQLEAVLADKQISVKAMEDQGWGPEISVDGVVPKAIHAVAKRMFGPEVVVTATVGLGASDSRFLRKAGVQAYGIGVLGKPEELTRGPHGPDEGFPAPSLASGVEWLEALVRELQ
jgi:acetylornithine deacetylase/succinyl-diaminopimelate desuccinylase-like protein